MKLLLSAIVFGIALCVAAVVLYVTGVVGGEHIQAPRPIAVGGDGVFTLFLLGGSTTHGEPYQDRLDMGRLVSLMYDGRFAGQAMSVQNLGQGSRTSSMVVADARRIAALKPDPSRTAVFVYCGNNEFLRLDDAPQRHAGERRLFDQPVMPDAKRAAVMAAYRENLLKIITTLRDAGVPVILSTVAVNQKDFPPLRSVLRDASNEAVVADLLAAGDRALDAGDTQTARSSYERALAVEPAFAHAAYMAGVCALTLGDATEARALLQQAVDHDANVYRATSEHNRIIHEIAAAHDVPLIDAVALLADASPGSVLGYELMWDNCHPTLEGYSLIAQALARQMGAMYGETRMPREVSLDEVRSAFGIGVRYESDIFGSRGEYLSAMTMLTWNRRPHAQQAGRYLDAAIALWPDSPRALCARALHAAVLGHTDESLGYWQRAYAADADFTLKRAGRANVTALMRAQGVTDLPGRLTSGDND